MADYDHDKNKRDGKVILKQSKESILQYIRNKIQKLCVTEYKKIEKEKDEIKRLKLQKIIQAKSLFVVLNELKKLSNKQWEQYAEELFEPLLKQSANVADQVDTLILKKSKDAKEYKKYEKMKRINIKAEEEFLDILERTHLNRKQLDRFLVLLMNHMAMQELAQAQNNLNWYEFLEAIPIVQRRLGFDQNWLVCLSLIQLYENLIRKKITDLGYLIKKSDTVDMLIPQLGDLIKEKEKRDVSLALKMSDGLKRTRNLMTHQGYKQPVLKSDLERIFREISELERTLYPETKMN